MSKKSAKSKIGAKKEQHNFTTGVNAETNLNPNAKGMRHSVTYGG